MVEKEYGEITGKALVDALINNGFDAKFFNDRDCAVDFVMSFISPEKTVAFGGSVTVALLGIKERAVEKGAVILDHSKQFPTQEEKIEVMRRQILADVHISSANAVTRQGFIVNVDLNGNRVAPMIFGPKKNIIIVGTNKIVKDIDAAYERIEGRAAPMNNIRLKRNNPCVVTGHCVDCSSPSRICSAYVVLKRRPNLSDMSIVVINESLGF